MSLRSSTLAAALLSFSALLPAGSAAVAADMPVKAVKPIIDVPFFMVNDNRITYSYQFTATDPGVPGKTAKQVYSFTHFDVWAYGTNFFTIDMLKSDHNDPAVPCGLVAGVTGSAVATEFYGLVRCRRRRPRRRHRVLRSVPQHPRLQRTLQHQAVLGRPAA